MQTTAFTCGLNSAPRYAEFVDRAMPLADPPDLLAHPLFRDMEAGLLQPVLDSISIRKVGRGTMLNSPEAPSGRLLLVLTGEIRAYDVTADGRELFLEIIPAGGFDGILSIAGRRGHFTDALVDSTVAMIGMQALERLVEAQPKIAFNLIGMIVERLERREGHLNAMVLQTPDEQLARLLLALADNLSEPSGDRIALDRRVTHQMLADMLGLRRETVTLHLASLRRAGAIDRNGRRIELDIPALRRVVDGGHVRALTERRSRHVASSNRGDLTSAARRRVVTS